MGRMIRALPGLSVVLLVLAAQLGCDSGPTLPPSAPTITGFVAEADAQQSILLVKRTGDDCGIRFQVTSGTTIFLRTRGGELQRTSFSQGLPNGQFVSVWSDGPTAGCPRQAVAVTVLVTPIYPD